MDGRLTDLGGSGINLGRHCDWSDAEPRPNPDYIINGGLPHRASSLAMGMQQAGKKCLASMGTSAASNTKYTPRKQLVWAQCQEYLRKPTLLLVQLDNLDASTKLALKTKLSSLKMSLVNPKPHILRKALKGSKWSNLEAAVVGSTSLLMSRAEPHELATALRFLNTQQQKVTLLGGKIGEYSFSVEGVKAMVHDVPSFPVLRAQLLGLLQAPAQSLLGAVAQAPMALTAALDQHVRLAAATESKEK